MGTRPLLVSAFPPDGRLSPELSTHDTVRHLGRPMTFARSDSFLESANDALPHYSSWR